MIGPKHLWSGDWESQSEAARAEAAARRPAAAPAQDAAGEPEAEQPTEVQEAAPPPPRARRITRFQLTMLLLLGATGVAVAIVGGLLIAGKVLPKHDNTKALPAVSSTPLKPKRGQTRTGAIYARDSPAVVLIRTAVGSGTGFLIDDKGTIVTNDHVVESASGVDVRFGADGRTISGRVLGTDPSSDLAVVRINPGSVPANVKPLKLADSSGVQIGDDVIAIGYPFGLDRTATEGIVSGLGRAIKAPNGFSIDQVIQTDAAINPGNSGGPLLDDGGNVIGVNSQIATTGSSSGNVGVGFVVPSNTVRQVVPRLLKGETIQRAWLGVTTLPNTLGNGGATVVGTNAGGPADKAGIQVGDIITTLDGHTVAAQGDVSSAIEAKHSGDDIQVTVNRGGQSLTLGVTLGTRPNTVP